MNSEDVLAMVNSIFQDVLDDEDLTITRPTTAEDVDDWDSLTHIQLVVAIEKKFNVRFMGDEIQEFADVGAMCDAIAGKLNAS